MSWTNSSVQVVFSAKGFNPFTDEDAMTRAATVGARGVERLSRGLPRAPLLLAEYREPPSAVARFLDPPSIGGLELEGAVFDVKVFRQATAQLVEDSGRIRRGPDDYVR